MYLRKSRTISVAQTAEKKRLVANTIGLTGIGSRDGELVCIKLEKAEKGHLTYPGRYSLRSGMSR